MIPVSLLEPVVWFVVEYWGILVGILAAIILLVFIVALYVAAFSSN